MRWMSMTRSAIERPKNRCVTITGVMAANGICVLLDHVGLAVAAQHLDLVAAGGDAIEPGVTIAVVVHAHIVLGDPDQPRSPG